MVGGLPEDADDFRYPGDAIEPEIQSELERALSGETVLPEKILDTDWGNIFIAYYPLHNESGEVVGALANGIRILIMYKNAGLALVIGLSLVATIVISKLIGCVLPLIAKKLHMDPAIMASPLITTLVDTCSILIYFNIATQVFQL